MSAPAVAETPVSTTLWVRVFKRPCDFLASLSLLVVASPLMLAIAVLVRLNMGSPVLFKQARLGRQGRVFNMFKFRSMSDARSDSGELLPDEIRLNAFGRFLRSTSLDELPQFLNILRGDMSFIGPRATLPVYEPIMRERFPTRLELLPGMTSLPAIRGRNALSIDEKYEMDVEYVQKCSLAFDFYIALMTIPVVLGRTNIEVEDNSHGNHRSQLK
jgi:lipopolysaccharide/colanic/teichoic acid biosynthesis glycosyltransferase